MEEMDKNVIQEEVAHLTQPNDVEEEALAVVDVTETIKEPRLQIRDEEVWTYKIPGLSAPRIGKPIKYKLLKEIAIVVIIVVAVALAIYFSVAAVQKDTFEFKNIDGGVELSKFNNTGYITELTIDYQTELKYQEGNSDPNSNFYFDKDESKPIVEIREYAFNCDEKLSVITIGEHVRTIDGKSFYTCNALERIEVDESNPYYCDVDGVLFNKDKTEIICYPIKHSNYRARVKGYLEDDDKSSDKYINDVLSYTIPSSVTKIGKLCFNYTDLVNVYMPEGVKIMESMSFFRASSLKNIFSYNQEGIYNSLPEGIEYVGSDALSYCQSLSYIFIPRSVSYIGHHAFWDTVYKENGELKGINCVNVARDEKDFKKNVDKGDQWRPKYDFLLFKKSVEINYGAERQW